MRPIIFIAIIALAFGAMYLVYSLMLGGEEKELVQTPKKVEEKVSERLVYVAKQDIPVGVVIEQSMLDKQTWPAHLIGPSFIVSSSDAPNIVGMVARSPFQEREVILRSKLANPEDPSFLAASLGAGMRAVTISVNGVTSVAGFAHPGDRVDVLLTHSIISDKEKEAATLTKEKSDDINGKYDRAVAETIISDVRVLAVDRKAMAGEAEGDAKKKKRMPSTITLELTQDDAQRVRLAEKEGELSLVLRPLKDKGASWVRPSAQEDLTRALPPGHFESLYGFDEKYNKNMSKKKSTKSRVTVVRGSKVEELEVEIENAE